MTIVTLIKKIREVALDETKKTWGDVADMLPAINTARHRLWGKRPEAFFVTKVLWQMPDDISVTTGNIDVLDRYAEAIVARAAHTLLMEQRRAGDKEKAAEQLTIYDRILGG